MARIKIDYGIDLGTTNSAICRMDKGEPVILKTDVLKDTMPSCISVNKKGSIKAGDAAYNSMKQDKRRATKSWKKEDSNTYIEFKRTMATDTKYSCSNINKDFTSEELSAEVLKTLKSFVTDETISSAVITVPAKFTVNQKTATLEAAKLAGFNKCELLQEPIAAAMAFGLSANEKDGIWMVFDFGGGTFDAALLKVEDGIIQVFDTEGDNYLGGKNLDYAIVDKIIVPNLKEKYSLDSYIEDKEKNSILREAMKTYAEDAKIQLSFKDKEDIISNLGDLGEDEDGEEIELDLTITKEQAFDAMRPYYQKAVDICKDLLNRHNLNGSQINKLILVGGPTYSPLIRQMLREQITPNVDTSIDPMTAVATGAALYASTIDADLSNHKVEVGTVKLEIGYSATSVEMIEFVSISLNPESRRQSVWVEFVRADNAWSSGKIEIDNKGDIIETNLLEGKANSFSIRAYDERGNDVPCFPNEFTIIQGTQVGAAPLPYNIGIAIWDSNKNKAVFRMAKGLDKNKPLPATGIVNNLKTSKILRPGVESDVMTIPIYQTDDFAEAEGRSASLYEYVADVVITGDEVDELIKEDSSVDITLKVDSSEQMKMEVHFLATDFTIEKELKTGKKQSIKDAEKEINKGLKEAQSSIDRLGNESIPVDDLKSKLEIVRNEDMNNSEKKMVLQHLKEVLREIERMDSSTEWQRLEKELREEFERLEAAQKELGNTQTENIISQLRSQTDSVIRSKDIKMGRDILQQITGLFFSLTMVYQCMGLIKHWNERFGTIRWKDSSRARQLINKGLERMNDNPTAESLQPIVSELFDIMPDDEAANAHGLLK